MKNIYFLLFLCIGLNTTAQIINIPDANFKAKLIEANTTNNIASSTYQSITPIVIDINGDNEIQINEALLVKRLDISNSNINSISGLEFFSNLRRLNCNNNQLSLINLNGLSSLKYLDCSYNNLNSLQVQDINNSIDYLNCSYNNLTSIVFPNFYEYLDMGDQYIVANFSHNQLNSVIFNSINTYEQLTDLDLSYNNINSISFHNIEILGGLNLSNNPLTSVDFSDFSLHSQSPDFIFGGLSLNYTNLTSVIIPSTVDIATSSSISNNSVLQSINIKNTFSNLECYPEYDQNGEETGNFICSGITIQNNPQLTLLCCDANEVNYYSTAVSSSVSVTSDCVLEIEDNTKVKFKIYPNPTTTNLNVQSDFEINNIVITNTLGQKLLSNINQSSIDVSSLSKGTYFITIETDNRKQTQKFIKN